MNTIYLDYNATTPVDPIVRDAMLPYLNSQFGNPSSLHDLGQAAAAAIRQAREEVAALLRSEPDEVIFTSGGTESSNLAIQGVMRSRCADRSGHLVISAIEHPATVEPARWLQRCGHSLTVVDCNDQGVIDPEDVAAAMQPNTVLVSIMHANNEVGSVQPVRAIADICRAAGAAFHVDAAQSAGKLSVDVDQINADLMTLAGHKFYAPKGVGALYVRKGVELEPLLRGGGQERGLSPGTENVAQIVGLGTAARLAAQNLAEAAQRMGRLRDALQAGLKAAVGSGLSVNAVAAERLPNTLSVNFPGVNAAELLATVPDICASTGAACHSGSTQLSATLAAMNLSPETARGTVRLSAGRYTTQDEVEHAVSRLASAWKRLVGR